MAGKNQLVQIINYLKLPLRQYWFLSLKCYTDRCSGTIQNALTLLTLRITEDSAKQMVDSLQLTVNSKIGLLGERNIFYVSPAHSVMLLSPMS